MTYKLLNLCAAFALVSGIGIVALEAPLYASLSDQGSVVMERTVSDSDAELRQAPVSISYYEQADAGIQLIIGVLLISLGFFLHGFVRVCEERPVHITVKPSKRKRTMWFWMEMRV